MQRILVTARHSCMEIVTVARLTPTLVLGAALMLAGCGSTTDPGATSDPGTTSQGGSEELGDRTFISSSVTGHDLVADSSVRLTFTGSQLSVTAGCNTLFGEYAVSQGSLSVTQLAGTEMGCPPELMAQDEWLATFLQSSPRLEVSGETLTLSDGAVELTLTDRVLAEPNQELEGTTWELDTHYANEAAAHWAGMENATLTLADGKAAVATGCNSGRASYTLEGDQLTFGPLMLTRMACPEPAMELERLVVGALDGQSLTVAIEAGQLRLTAPDGTGLGLHATTSANP